MLEEDHKFAQTNLKSDENCAGTDGKGNHSHEGTHDEV